jgi:hypothetical protein
MRDLLEGGDGHFIVVGIVGVNMQMERNKENGKLKQRGSL